MPTCKRERERERERERAGQKKDAFKFAKFEETQRNLNRPLEVVAKLV